MQEQESKWTWVCHHSSDYIRTLGAHGSHCGYIQTPRDSRKKPDRTPNFAGSDISLFKVVVANAIVLTILRIFGFLIFDQNGFTVVFQFIVLS